MTIYIYGRREGEFSVVQTIFIIEFVPAQRSVIGCNCMPTINCTTSRLYAWACNPRIHMYCVCVCMCLYYVVSESVFNIRADVSLLLDIQLFTLGPIRRTDRQQWHWDCSCICRPKTAIRRRRRRRRIKSLALCPYVTSGFRWTWIIMSRSRYTSRARVLCMQARCSAAREASFC